MPEEAATEIEKQIKRLERSHPDSAETAIIRTYLDWMTGLPWGDASEDDLGPRARARRSSTRTTTTSRRSRSASSSTSPSASSKTDARRGRSSASSGPPGVGKTSLGRSIARALGRKFVRLSLGGVRDEAEIRGHRRTYVGAHARAASSRASTRRARRTRSSCSTRSTRSAPTTAATRPRRCSRCSTRSRTSRFRDHYLGVPYDLSKVLFIATANVLDPIQPAFLDRMEVIRLSGYTAGGEAARSRARHLIPKQMEENGLTERTIEFTDDGARGDHRGYTREAGLRNLEREIGAICRKVARARSPRAKTRAVPRSTPRRSRSSSAPASTSRDELLKRDQVGVATGLAWTAVGGDILFIEALAVRGKGGLLLTGQLGDVMKESAQAALSYARAHAARARHRRRLLRQRTTSTSTCPRARSPRTALGRHHDRRPR